MKLFNYKSQLLFLWVFVFVLRFLQVVEAEDKEELNHAQASSRATHVCVLSWKTATRSSSSANGKPNSSFCRVVAWRNSVPKEDSGCSKWWDLALVVAALKKERWGRNFKSQMRSHTNYPTFPTQAFDLWCRKQDGQHYMYCTCKICMFRMSEKTSSLLLKLLFPAHEILFSCFKGMFLLHLKLLTVVTWVNAYYHRKWFWHFKSFCLITTKTISYSQTLTLEVNGPDNAYSVNSIATQLYTCSHQTVVIKNIYWPCLCKVLSSFSVSFTFTCHAWRLIQNHLR